MKLFCTFFMALVLPAAMLAQINFSDGLRSYHPMNGDNYNVSPFTHTFHSNFFNSSFGENASGIENAAGAFDGASRVNINTRLVNQISDFSVELWFRAESEFFQVLFWEGQLNQRSVWIRVEPVNNRIRCIAGTPASAATIDTDGSYADGQWHHLVLTAANSNLLRVYIDGTLNSEVQQSYTSGTTTQFTRFGCRDDITQFLTGGLDEVRVWNYPLSESEVQALFEQSRIMIDMDDAGTFCAGASVQVPFSVIGNQPFQADNAFYLQLSDPDGSFRYPLTIGSSSGTGSGVITGVVPDGIGTGDNYRLRVVASRLPRVSDNAAAISITSPNAVPGNDIYSDLILYYPFNGDATDFSGLGLNGAMSGSLVPVVDRNGNENSALSFGGGARVGVGSPFPLTSYNNTQRPVSIAFWLRQSSTPASFGYIFSAWQPTAGGGDGLWIGTTSGGTVRWRVNGNQFVQAGNTNNQWQHFTCVYNGSQLQIYRNGQLISATNVSGNVRILSTIEMGRNTQGNSGAQELTGRLDEFRVYERALTAQEAFTLYQDGLAWNNGPLCDGDSVQLFGPGFPGLSYDWTGPNAFSSQDQNPEFAPFSAILNTGQYELTLALDGCVGVPNITNLQSTVGPVAETFGASVCAGDTAFISATGADDDAHYRWYSDPLGINLIASGEAQIAVNPAQTTVYYVNIQPNPDCQGPLSEVLVQVGADNVQAEASSTLLCFGESVTLSGAGAESYEWNNGVQDGEAFTPLTSDVYVVIGTDEFGCIGTDSVEVIVAPEIELPVISGDLFLTCDASGVWYYVAGLPGFEFQWSVPDGAEFTGQGSDSIQVNFNSQFGVISVVAVSPEGCQSELSEVEVQCVTGLTASKEAGLSVFPNPVRDVLQLDWSGGQEVLTGAVFASDGRQVEQVLVLPGAMNVLNVSSWERGVYFLRLSGSESSYVIKVIKGE
jgi:hypothetical protein